MSRSARLGTSIRGYRLPPPLEIDSLDSKIDDDLAEDFESELAGVFEKAWLKTSGDLDRVPVIGSTPPRPQPVSTINKTSEETGTESSPTTPPQSFAAVEEHPTDVEFDTPKCRPYRTLNDFDPSVRQSGDFRLKIVGSRRGPRTDTSHLEARRKVSFLLLAKKARMSFLLTCYPGHAAGVITRPV